MDKYVECIVNLISNLGFPTAIAIVVIWYISSYIKDTNARIDAYNEKYHEDILAFQKSLDNNTAVITALIEKLK